MTWQITASKSSKEFPWQILWEVVWNCVLGCCAGICVWNSVASAGSAWVGWLCYALEFACLDGCLDLVFR